jgi:hypothetical protein
MTGATSDPVAEFGSARCPKRLVLVGRNVIADSWSDELVEDYDANYWRVFREMVAHARRQVGDVPMHLYEARLQYDEQERRAAE